MTEPSDNHLVQNPEERPGHDETLSGRETGLLAAILCRISDGVVVADAAANVAMMNRVAEELTGWTEAEALGRPVGDTFTLLDRETRRPCEHHLQGPGQGGNDTAEWNESLLVARDGQERIIAWSSKPVLDSGTVKNGSLLVFRDVTAARLAEEQIHTQPDRAAAILVQTERFKGIADLASGVGHNFQNLLQIIMSSAHMALAHMELGNPLEVKTSLDQILESAKMGSRTVRRLQDFAQAGYEKPGLQGKVFDLSKTLNEAIEMSKPWWKTAAEKDGITIILRRRLHEGCLVRGNENELFEVAVNLIKNATEALPIGGEITITAAIESKDVVLRVSDTGVGIAKENLGKVFEPFWTTKGDKGTGMGLASCFGIVSRHSGGIELSSKEGRGTSFVIRVPLAEKTVEEQRIAPLVEDHVQRRILVVDDMQTLVSMLEYGLTRYGQIVFTAYSGSQALDVFSRNPVDVVICDLGMPEMNGWQVGKAIKAVCELRGMPKPPFILLTGWGGEIQDSHKITESGVDRIVDKPVMIPTLMKIVQELAQNGIHQKSVAVRS